jgi:D-glycero-D-manno-heptose 1,7-bisphosphate phosphatase
MLTRALFLDRDGVINVNHGYVHTRESFDFIEGIFELACFAAAQRYLIIVVTNQAGIGRGFYTEEQFQLLNKWMSKKFMDVGAPISHVYFSPYHPTDGKGEYLKDDFSRKPNPGMLLEAQKDFSIDLSHSVLIGDSTSDIVAGNVAGVGTNLLYSTKCSSELGQFHYHQITKLQDGIPFLTRMTKERCVRPNC